MRADRSEGNNVEYSSNASDENINTTAIIAILLLLLTANAAAATHPVEMPSIQSRPVTIVSSVTNSLIKGVNSMKTIKESNRIVNRL